MPRLFVDYRPVPGPLLQLAVRARTESGNWGPIVRVDAVVDSGATRSYLRTVDAAGLGLSPAQLPPGPTIRLAGGATMTSHRLAVSVFAAILNPTTNQRWGPTVRLEPMLAAQGDRVLGLLDFFQAFEVCFWPDPDNARFSLVY